MEAFETEAAVKARYGLAAQAPEAALCCPVSYDAKYLKAIPAEVIEKDYGCGDPSKHLRPGETVLDLGSGGGKICFIAAQVVGAAGRVIGVDMTDEMLALARRNAPAVAKNIGFSNVEFRKGLIQDLALDVELFDAYLRDHSIAGTVDFLQAQRVAAELRATKPLIPESSVNVVVSNCVLNLVETAAKARLFMEIFRVLTPGGRAVISDIVADSEVPAQLRMNPELWSGCISGAMTLEAFANSFAEAGFDPVKLLKKETDPWRVVEGIAFRSVTIEATKPLGTAPSQARTRRFALLDETCCGVEKCC